MNLKDSFVELRCAFDSSNFQPQSAVSSGETRTLQYAEGFKKFFEIYSQYTDDYSNVYVLDNTLKDKSFLDARILLEIPDGVNLIFSNQNTFGRINKGAGDIEGWNYIKKLFKKYKYFFHYEPRLIMESPTFIEVFLKNKNNTFLKHPTLDRQFQTGAFITKTKDLIDYLDYRTPEGLCNPYRCIEDDICYFFKNIKKNNFTLVSKSGMLRHDAAIDTWVEY